jgi:ABC-type uncharacterized transport system permease subunit
MSEPVTKPQSDEFEFTDSHNMVFHGLSKAMLIVGIVQSVLALVYAVPGVLALLVLNTPVVVIKFLHVVVVGAMALWTMRASRSVKEIVRTEGDDIRHLMDAMASLKKLFLLQVVVFAIIIALNVAALVSGADIPRGL